jgi:hypothetical protein
VGRHTAFSGSKVTEATLLSVLRHVHLPSQMPFALKALEKGIVCAVSGGGCTVGGTGGSGSLSVSSDKMVTALVQMCERMDRNKYNDVNIVNGAYAYNRSLASSWASMSSFPLSSLSSAPSPSSTGGSPVNMRERIEKLLRQVQQQADLDHAIQMVGET